MNLRQKIRRGFAFVFVSTVGNRVISFVGQIFLLRLLDPRDFGAQAFGLLVINTLSLVRAMGVGEALIARAGADQCSSDTGFVLALLLGTLLYTAVYVAAPLIALLASEGDPDLIVKVLRLLGLVLLLQALGSVPKALLERELEFHKQFVINSIDSIVFVSVAVSLALQGHGVWSLVWGRLSGGLGACLAAWWYAPWRPKFQFSWTIASEVMRYGRFVAGSALVSFLVVNLDDALVARLGGINLLGFYATAYLLTNLPVTSLTHLVNRVAFPAYARLLEEGGSTHSMFLRLVRGTVFVALPAAICLGLLAEPLVVGVLGLQWAPLAGLIPWLAPYGFLRSYLSNTGPLFNAMGFPQAIFKVNLLQLALLALLLHPLIQRLGDVGAGVAVLAATVLSAPLAFRLLQRDCGVEVASQWAAVRPVLLPAAAMALTVVGVRHLFLYWTESNAVAELVCGVCAGGAVYASVVFWRRRELMQEVVWIFRGSG